MYKQSIGTGPQLSEKQLKSIIKHNQIKIKHLESSVNTKRQQLQDFSKNITKLVQKKLIYQKNNKQAYKHPNFNPQYYDPQISYYVTLKQQIYAQIQQFKNKINVIKSNHEPAIINQYHHKQNVIKNLDKQLQKLCKQKNYLQEKMQENKVILEQYNNNQCIKDIQSNTKELEELKKIEKGYDKQWNQLNAEEIQENMIIFQYQNQIKKVQHPEPIQPGDEPVTPSQIQQLIKQINKHTQNRKNLQKKSQAQLSSLNRNIINTLQQNRKIQLQIRSLESTKMKKQLQLRHIRQKKQKQQKMKKQKDIQQEKYQRKIKNMQNSIPQALKRNYQSIYQMSSYEGLDCQTNRQEYQNQIRDTMFLTDSYKNSEIKRQIIIGQWIEQNRIRDRQSLALNQKCIINRAVSMRVFSENNSIDNQSQIKDIMITYIDLQGKQHLTRGIKGKKIEQNSNKKDNIEETIIQLDEVEDFRYMPQISTKLGLKWMMRDGKVIQIGQFSEQSAKDLVVMDNLVIFQVDFCLDKHLENIGGLTIKLKQKKHPQSPPIQTKSPPTRWRSTSQVSLLTKKKVFIKSSPHKNRNNDLPIVDHRLLLNRKNKMV